MSNTIVTKEEYCKVICHPNTTLHSRSERVDAGYTKMFDMDGNYLGEIKAKQTTFFETVYHLEGYRYSYKWKDEEYHKEEL